MHVLFLRKNPQRTQPKQHTDIQDIHMADRSSLPAVSPPPSSPRRDANEATARFITAILLSTFFIIIGVVAALCLRVRRTWHNRKERRRLTKRVVWLRDLLQLLPPAPAPASSEEVKGGAGSATTAAAQQAAAVRTVLARRIEATVSEVDRLVASPSMSMSYCGCCLLGFARSYELARRLEHANKDVDEVYSHLLPVVTQIDAAHRVEQVLVGVMQQQQQLRDKNNHSDAQQAAAQIRPPNGSKEFDWKPLLSENNDDQASTVSGRTAFEITVDR